MDRRYLHEILYRGEESIILLSKMTVTLAGVGAIGTWAALGLARMGITRFRLIDKDKVEIHNISTQFYEPSDLGKTKVSATQRKLYTLCKARAETHRIELTEQNAEALLLGSNLVICSFDNNAGRQAVKNACLQRKIPCLQVGMNGEHMYCEAIWAENYIVPEDPAHITIDPCDYPLSTTLVILASTMSAELAVLFLIKGVKGQCRLSMGDLIT